MQTQANNLLHPPPESYEMLRCGPSSSLDFLDLEEYDKRQELQQLYIHETPVGFYVCARLTIANKIWYLTTQRDRYTPYIFKDLHRLNDYLRQHWPKQNVLLKRDQKVPRPADESAKPLSTKIFRKLTPKKRGPQSDASTDKAS